MTQLASCIDFDLITGRDLITLIDVRKVRPYVNNIPSQKKNQNLNNKTIFNFQSSIHWLKNVLHLSHIYKSTLSSTT